MINKNYIRSKPRPTGNKAGCPMKKKLEKWYKSRAYRFLALVILLTVVLLLADFGLILPNCSTKTKLITHGLYLIGFYNAICAIREEKEREEE